VHNYVDNFSFVLKFYIKLYIKVQKSLALYSLRCFFVRKVDVRKCFFDVLEIVLVVPFVAVCGALYNCVIDFIWCYCVRMVVTFVLRNFNNILAQNGYKI